ncbi:MAG: hypothetical protein ACJA08_000404 [Cyclobacteriaceae bacterium]|jgi:hypothetical protein
MRFLITLLTFIITFTACRDKVICPAFQSTYILDDSVRMAYYSYLWKIDEAERTKYLAAQNSSGDTSLTASLLPSSKKDYYAHAAQYIVPEREVNKSKYGIVKYEPYWLKNYHLKTAPMENVLTPDKIVPLIQMDTTPVDVGEFYAADFNDSLVVDSTAVAIAGDTAQAFVLPTLARAPPPKKKAETKYLYGYDPKDKELNVEQDYYNKYFGQYLIAKQPKPKPEPIPEPDRSSGAPDSTAVNANEFMSTGDSTSGDGFIKPKKKKKSRGKNNADDSSIEGDADAIIEDPVIPEEKPKVVPVEPEDDGF